MENILFASVDLKVLDKKTATEEILKVDQSLWYWNNYRATNMLPLMTKGSQAGAEGAHNKNNGEFGWVDYTPVVIKDWFEDVVFPWMGMKTRIMVLMTKANEQNNLHIDCDERDMGTIQHKFRVVLHGNTETLFFKTSNGDLHAPAIEGAFIMDGSWPHGMKNDTGEYKLTLAAGAPWCGNNSYDNITILLKKNDYNLPEDFHKYFKT